MELDNQKADRREKLKKKNASKKDKGNILHFIYKKGMISRRMKEKMDEALAIFVTMEKLSFAKL